MRKCGSIIIAIIIIIIIIIIIVVYYVTRAVSVKQTVISFKSRLQAKPLYNCYPSWSDLRVKYPHVAGRGGRNSVI